MCRKKFVYFSCLIFINLFSALPEKEMKKPLKNICKKQESIVFHLSMEEHYNTLTLSWPMYLSYRNQSTDLLSKSMDWFLYDRDLCHEKVKVFRLSCYDYRIYNIEKEILTQFQPAYTKIH